MCKLGGNPLNYCLKSVCFNSSNVMAKIRIYRPPSSQSFIKNNIKAKKKMKIGPLHPGDLG